MHDLSEEASLRLNALRQALRLSEKMLASARQEQWDTFANTLKRRQHFLNILAAPAAVGADDVVLFGVLLKLNKSISLQVVSVRDTCKEALRNIHQGRRANTAYHNTMQE